MISRSGKIITWLGCEDSRETFSERGGGYGQADLVYDSQLVNKTRSIDLWHTQKGLHVRAYSFIYLIGRQLTLLPGEARSRNMEEVQRKKGPGNHELAYDRYIM